MTELMSIKEAKSKGITKLRLDVWANTQDHLEFTVLQPHPVTKQGGGDFGPWVKLWSPVNELIGEKNPQELLITTLGDLDDKCWRPYEEPYR